MKVTLVAIAGGSGSGKTWLARELEQRLTPHAAILSLDDFYADLSHMPVEDRARCNFDAPEAVDWALLQQCLEGLLRGESVMMPQYDFTSHTRKPRRRRWVPKPVVLVEGLWPWQQSGLRDLYALKVFRSAEEQIRLTRRLNRDTTERGRTPESVHHQWAHQVEPMHAQFVQPQRSSANITLPHHAPAWRLNKLEQRIRTLAQIPTAGS
jgi:uridine kinase